MSDSKGIFFKYVISIMSGHGPNLIFFPPTSDNISFLPYPTPPQSGRHMCITPKPCVTLEIQNPDILAILEYSEH